MLGTFEPVDEEINEIHTTSWTKLEGQMHQAHAQLRRKKGYKQALHRTSKEEKESPKLLPEYSTDSNMEMEAVMKRPEVNLEDAKDADKWKAKVMNMLETKFASTMSKSSTDVVQTLDIIVFSRTVEDHLNHLEQVFTALQKADLKIKASKCEFFKSHVCYLGFLIGESGIRCDRSKVEAINKITAPTSIEEV